MTVPVLGRPSLEESYPSLANRSCTGGQAGWNKVGRGGAPARKIRFVSLVAYGTKVSHSALATGDYSFWNQAGQFPMLNTLIAKHTYSQRCFPQVPVLSLTFSFQLAVQLDFWKIM